LISTEWAVAIFRQARAAGLATGYVTNGNATPEALDYLRPWLDIIKVDLKTMDDGRYHKLGGRLKPVLDSIGAMHAARFWLEVVTLVVPGFNDSGRKLDGMARFLAGISPDIPWHVTAFHRDYKMTGPENTTPETLLRAAAAGRNAGLRYVYAGNLPGRVGDLENTRCATCGALLIERFGFRILRNRIAPGGACPECRTPIPGFWGPGRAKRNGDERLVYKRCG
jgi:pyruvate formate lyase activating enzyme